jgi:hypothetical protein
MSRVQRQAQYLGHYRLPEVWKAHLKHVFYRGCRHLVCLLEGYSKEFYKERPLGKYVGLCESYLFEVDNLRLAKRSLGKYVGLCEIYLLEVDNLRLAKSRFCTDQVKPTETPQFGTRAQLTSLGIISRPLI